jgi:hypothetical protein
MEYVITVYRLPRVPISEIRWTGKLPKDGTRFAIKHGGDFIEIESLEEYVDTLDCLPY